MRAGGCTRRPTGKSPLSAGPIYRGLTAVVCRPRNLSCPHSRESGEGGSGEEHGVKATLLPAASLRLSRYSCGGESFSAPAAPPLFAG